MAADQTVYTQTHIHIYSYMIFWHINTEMAIRQTYPTEK